MLKWIDGFISLVQKRDIICIISIQIAEWAPLLFAGIKAVQIVPKTKSLVSVLFAEKFFFWMLRPETAFLLSSLKVQAPAFTLSIRYYCTSLGSIVILWRIHFQLETWIVDRVGVGGQERRQAGKPLETDWLAKKINLKHSWYRISFAADIESIKAGPRWPWSVYLSLPAGILIPPISKGWV